MPDESIPRADRPHTQYLTHHPARVTAADREAVTGHSGMTFWLTGLSGSGKSTIAVALEQALIERDVVAYRLDGDHVRTGLCRDLGFSAPDRSENLRRVGEVCRLFADAGVVTVAAFVSPYAADRDVVRRLHAEHGHRFVEIFVDTPLAVCESRDPKGLYRKARAGEIRGFTGIDDPYEPPATPDLVLRTDAQDVAACVAACLRLL